MELFKIGYII